MKKDENKKSSKIGVLILYIIILIILICFSYSMVQLLIEPTGVFVVENGKIYKEETTIGYIMRDEQAIIGDNHQNGIVDIKTEGERTAKGDAIFRYCSDKEEELEKKIAELDEQIQEAINGQNTNIFSTDIQLLEKQIEEKLLLVQKANNLEEIESYKSEISSYMIKKAKIAGELSPAGSYINKLITQRSEYENQLNSGQEYVKANISGIVSYKIDGYEEELNVSNLDTITRKQLEEVKIKNGQLIATSTEGGKIVNNFYCYIATILSSDNAINANVGDIIKLRLGNSDEVSAEIVKISEFVDGKAVIVFKVTKDVEYLINYRKISVDVIWWSATGLKIPNSALITEEGKNYIVRSRIGYIDKILVKIENQNESYAIINNYTTQELREMGYSTEEITSMKNISLYDQIVLNPEI